VSGSASRQSWTQRWEAYWFEEVPPHAYAALRIALAAVILAGHIGLGPIDRYWALDGISPLPSNPNGPRAWLLEHGLGVVAGRTFWLASCLSSVGMLLGWKSNLFVLTTFMGLWLQSAWNRYPLSSAHTVATVLLFCLVWADTSRVWSIDARQRGRDGGGAVGASTIWPLRLLRYQVALIYVSSGLTKILYPVWRDGTAVYWAINLNAFHRFPWPIPVALEPMLWLLTWSTLAFELLFPVLVWFRRTRPAVLLLGIALHLGLLVTLELGPFSWVMMASYVAFLDPKTVQQWMEGSGRRNR
jgi:hypothetical protein